jgi:uncharacterized protein
VSPMPADAATVRRFLQLLEQGNIDEWITLWAEDAEHHYPYGTEMFPPHLTGRAAIYDRWKDTPGMFDTMLFPVRDLWGDGDTAIVRFDGDCVLRSTKEHYRNSYVAVLTFDAAGLITEYWEYFDPITAGTAFGLASVSYTSP